MKKKTLAPFVIIFLIIIAITASYSILYSHQASANSITHDAMKSADMVSMAKEYLANRLSVDIEAIKVIEIESVSWPNTALGCPKPGFMYGQVITPGYRLVLEHAGKVYSYHTDQKRLVVSCDTKNPFYRRE